ncbi:MAG: type 1 glutamine amidotransferase [Hydrogenibacillus schlegelii]|uniref:Type 1 glutamine amidotransferase n=1 Tax=Hydrogenibacillus schlegelii TaxID=1484 RepID=A0A947CZG9_HYDSH|nr:type 1 glutamine amidotransferase [Hydrogenibacillus schlegelii]
MTAFNGTTADQAAGKKVLALVDDLFEDLELWYPVYRLQEIGGSVTLAGPEAGRTYTGKHGVPAVSDVAFRDVDPKTYAMLLIPGGWAPDKLRRDPNVLEIVRAFDDARKPIGIICHAGWVLISARVLSGRRVTSTPGIKDDMQNAGAYWVDEPVVVDGNLISARRSPDLPAYGRALA